MSKQALKRVRRHLNMEVNRGPLDAYAWPGGYPTFYLCHDGESLCPACVNAEIALVDEAIRSRDQGSGWLVVATDVNWEDDSMFCANCNKQIESAYGEPSEAR